MCGGFAQTAAMFRPRRTPPRVGSAADEGIEDAESIIAHQLAAAVGWNAFETAMMHGLDQDPATVDEARDQFLTYARRNLHEALTRPQL
jgi:hypothetical protein